MKKRQYISERMRSKGKYNFFNIPGQLQTSGNNGFNHGTTSLFQGNSSNGFNYSKDVQAGQKMFETPTTSIQMDSGQSSNNIISPDNVMGDVSKSTSKATSTLANVGAVADIGTNILSGGVETAALASNIKNYGKNDKYEDSYFNYDYKNVVGNDTVNLNSAKNQLLDKKQTQLAQLKEDNRKFISSSTVSGMEAGASSGAGVGAAIGSIIPGAGTVIGGAIGGFVGGVAGTIGGYFGSKKKAKGRLQKGEQELEEANRNTLQQIDLQNNAALNKPTAFNVNKYQDGGSIFTKKGNSYYDRKGDIVNPSALLAEKYYKSKGWLNDEIESTRSLGKRGFDNFLVNSQEVKNISDILLRTKGDTLNDKDFDSLKESNTSLFNIGVSEGDLIKAANSRNITSGVKERVESKGTGNSKGMYSYGLSNIKADGGLVEFNTGGTHEENPNMGIPQGVSKVNNKPNLVEEGETRWQDYIFSERVKLSKEDTDAVGLPKRMKNKSLAEASKYLSKESKDRPNDVISKKGLDVMMDRLVALSEQNKMKDQLKELAASNPEGLEGTVEGIHESNVRNNTQDVQKMSRGGDLFRKTKDYLGSEEGQDSLNEGVANTMRLAPLLEGYMTNTSKPSINPILRTAPGQVEELTNEYNPNYISESDAVAPIERSETSTRNAIANATVGNNAAYLASLRNLYSNASNIKADALQKARMQNNSEDKYKTSVELQRDITNKGVQRQNIEYSNNHNNLLTQDRLTLDSIRMQQEEETRLEKNDIMASLLDNISKIGSEKLLRKDTKNVAKEARESGISSIKANRANKEKSEIDKLNEALQKGDMQYNPVLGKFE